MGIIRDIKNIAKVTKITSSIGDILEERGVDDYDNLLDDINQMKDLAKTATGISSSLAETASGISSSLGKIFEYREEDEDEEFEDDEEVEEVRTKNIPDITCENGKTVINTVDGMSSWLQKMQTPQMSPSALQALQSQIQVLNFVKSPTLTGMAIDTMITCLHKAIQTATSHDEKEAVRESFALMIQGFMFFSEAQLQYAINSNKEEGAQLLSQAGGILAKSVISVATLAATGGMAAAAVGDVVVKNVFSKPSGQKSFFGQIVTFFGNKKEIKEKQRQHIESLKNAFSLFDRYSTMIGPSIIIHSMLDRYGAKIIEDFEKQKYRNILISTELEDDDFFSNMEIFQSAQKRNLSGHDYIIYCRDEAVKELKADEESLAEKIEELEHNRKKFEEISPIKLAARKNLKENIEQLEKDISYKKRNVKYSKQHLEETELAVKRAAEIKPEIDAYAAKFHSITDKFALNSNPSASLTPPPVTHQTQFHISINGQTSGPYPISKLQEMIQQGTLTRDNYVWTQEMTNWEKAGNVESLAHLFGAIPPPPPPM